MRERVTEKKGEEVEGGGEMTRTKEKERRV